MITEINIGDKVDYDAGSGADRWEVMSVDGDEVYLSNTYGATTTANIRDIVSI